MTMAEDHILTRIQKFIRDQMHEGADHLATGGAKSMEEYNRMVGRIEGLALVEREMLDQVDKLSKED